LGTDIIFISDLRLKRKDGFDIANKLDAALLRETGRKYKLWFNSNLSGRGVGILIAKDLDAVVDDGMEDENQNILALKCKIKNTNFVLVSIYGPNGVCENFFNRLGLFLRDMSPDAKYADAEGSGLAASSTTTRNGSLLDASKCKMDGDGKKNSNNPIEGPPASLTLSACMRWQKKQAKSPRYRTYTVGQVRFWHLLALS
jgi:hypothetical protein